MVLLHKVASYLEELYPLHWAQDWDKVGLVVGDPSWEVTHLRLAVDPTLAEAQIAASRPGTLLITHHPLLLRGVNFVSTRSGKGSVITKLIEARCALWCGHTNADRSLHGTVGAWLNTLELADPVPLVTDGQKTPENGQFGLGAVGTLEQGTTVAELAAKIASVTPKTAQGVLYTGDPGREVRTVAVCPGAGDSFLEHAARSGADAYITSDLRHHPALEHLESVGDPLMVPALIDLPHFASEWLYLPQLAERLTRMFPTLSIEVSTNSSDPFTGAAR